MSDSHENRPQADTNVAELEAMGAHPDGARGGTVLVVLISALALMAGAIILGVPLTLKVGWNLIEDRQWSVPSPQLDELRAYEADALGTAKKLDNGLFRIPIAAGKAALLANPGLLASAGAGPAPAPAEDDGAVAEMSEEELAAKGMELFNGAKICSSCHRSDSTDRLVGPGLKGIFGRSEKMADGTELVVDEAYLIESLKEPNAKVVEGYPPAMTPQTFTDAELASLVAYLKTL